MIPVWLSMTWPTALDGAVLGAENSHTQPSNSDGTTAMVLPSGLIATSGGASGRPDGPARRFGSRGPSRRLGPVAPVEVPEET